MKAFIHGILIGLAAVANWYLQPMLPSVAPNELASSGWQAYLPMVWSIIVPTTIGYAAGVLGKTATK